MKKLVQLKDKNNNNYDPINLNYENRLLKLEGRILYNDETGTVGDITLNDNLTNYKKIEIEFAQSNWSYIQSFGTDKGYITLKAHNLYDSTSVQNIYQTYILNGNTLKKQYGAWNINDGAFTEDITMLTITKIIGYK